MVLLQDVLTHTWGQRVIRFYDLDTHLIEAGETLKSVAERSIRQGKTMEAIAEKMDVTIDELHRILASV